MLNTHYSETKSLTLIIVIKSDIMEEKRSLILQSFCKGELPRDDTLSEKFLSLLFKQLKDHDTCSRFIHNTVLQQCLLTLVKPSSNDPEAYSYSFFLRLMNHIFQRLDSTQCSAEVQGILEASRAVFSTACCNSNLWSDASVRCAWINSFPALIGCEHFLKQISHSNTRDTMWKKIYECIEDKSWFVRREAINLFTQIYSSLSQLANNSLQEPYLSVITSFVLKPLRSTSTTEDSNTKVEYVAERISLSIEILESIMKLDDGSVFHLTNCESLVSYVCKLIEGVKRKESVLAEWFSGSLRLLQLIVLSKADRQYYVESVVWNTVLGLCSGAGMGGRKCRGNVLSIISLVGWLWKRFPESKNAKIYQSFIIQVLVTFIDPHRQRRRVVLQLPTRVISAVDSVCARVRSWIDKLDTRRTTRTLALCLQSLDDNVACISDVDLLVTITCQLLSSGSSSPQTSRLIDGNSSDRAGSESNGHHSNINDSDGYSGSDSSIELSPVNGLPVVFINQHTTCACLRLLSHILSVSDVNLESLDLVIKIVTEVISSPGSDQKSITESLKVVLAAFHNLRATENYSGITNSLDITVASNEIMKTEKTESCSSSVTNAENTDAYNSGMTSVEDIFSPTKRSCDSVPQDGEINSPWRWLTDLAAGLKRAACSRVWDTRDSVVEFIGHVVQQFNDVSTLMSWLCTESLHYELVWSSLQDGESYVRATAVASLQHIAAYSSAVWSDLTLNHIKQHEVLTKLLHMCRDEPEAFARRAAVICASRCFFLPSLLSPSDRQRILVALRESENDLDWEIKLSVVAFWREYTSRVIVKGGVSSVLGNSVNVLVDSSPACSTTSCHSMINNYAADGPCNCASSGILESSVVGWTLVEEEEFEESLSKICEESYNVGQERGMEEKGQTSRRSDNDNFNNDDIKTKQTNENNAIVGCREEYHSDFTNKINDANSEKVTRNEDFLPITLFKPLSCQLFKSNNHVSHQTTDLQPNPHSQPVSNQWPRSLDSLCHCGCLAALLNLVEDCDTSVKHSAVVVLAKIRYLVSLCERDCVLVSDCVQKGATTNYELTGNNVESVGIKIVTNNESIGVNIESHDDSLLGNISEVSSKISDKSNIEEVSELSRLKSINESLEGNIASKFGKKSLSPNASKIIATDFHGTRKSAAEECFEQRQFISRFLSLDLVRLYHESARSTDCHDESEEGLLDDILWSIPRTTRASTCEDDEDEVPQIDCY